MAYKTLKKDKTILQDKKTGELSVVQIPLVPMTYYWQFLKLLTELEDNKHKIKINSFGAKGVLGGNRKGTISEVKVKINKSVFDMIDLDYFRKQPSLLNAKLDMKKFDSKGKVRESYGAILKKSYMNTARKWYQDNYHLVKDYSVKMITSPDELDSDDNYFTVQIPKSLNKLDIKRQLEMITDYHDLLDTKSKSRVIKFEKLLSHKQFDRLFRCLILKYRGWTNREIGEALGYTMSDVVVTKYSQKLREEETYSRGKKKDLIPSKKTSTVKGGVSSILRCYQSAQHLLYNLMTNNLFPKTRL